MSMRYVIRDDGTIWYKSTLAHELDTRNVSYGEPSASDIPATVNPYQIASKLFGRHLRIVKVNNADESMIHCLPALRTLLPVEDKVIIVREVPREDDLILRAALSDSACVRKTIVASDAVSRSKING